MKPYEIYIAYVSWGTEGKRRPVLVLGEQGAKAAVLRITTQYDNKSDAVQSKYLAILDWQQSGLYMPSYIDTSKIIDLPLTTMGITPIGRLSGRDRERLIERTNVG